MKALYVIVGLVFLASCTGGTQVINTPEDNTEVVVPKETSTSEELQETQEEAPDEEVVDELEQIIDELEAEVEVTEISDEVVLDDENSDSNEEEGNILDEINEEVKNLDDLIEDSLKTSQIDATYTNPKGLVDMVVDYSLDENGVITKIGVTATTYDVTDFNNQIQSLIGSTLEEAAEYTSSSSLTGEAFVAAIKSEL